MLNVFLEKIKFRRGINVNIRMYREDEILL